MCEVLFTVAAKQYIVSLLRHVYVIYFTAFMSAFDWKKKQRIGNKIC